jgi:hypothetical protein
LATYWNGDVFDAYVSVTGDGYDPGWTDFGGTYTLLGSMSVTDGSAAPQYTVALNPDTPNGLNGWYTSIPTVSVNCTDDLAVTFCPDGGTLVEGVNAAHSVGSATDGNANSTDVTIPAVNIDTVKPTIAASVSGTKDSTGKYTGVATVHFTCVDANLDVCPADVHVTATSTVSRTATDLAGNTSTATVLVPFKAIVPVKLLAPVVTTNAKTHDKYGHAIIRHGAAFTLTASFKDGAKRKMTVRLLGPVATDYRGTTGSPVKVDATFTKHLATSYTASVHASSTTGYRKYVVTTTDGTYCIVVVKVV